jgi:hypothetical protein
LEIVKFDEKASNIYGDVRAELERKGLVIGAKATSVEIQSPKSHPHYLSTIIADDYPSAPSN